MATIKEYRDKTKGVLEQDFKALFKKVQDIRFSLKMGKLKDTSQISKIKKSMAQIRSVISEKEILGS